MYEVEWCTKQGICPETGDAEPCLDEYASRDFRFLVKAREFAESLSYPQDLAVDQVHIKEFVYDDDDDVTHVDKAYTDYEEWI